MSIRGNLWTRNRKRVQSTRNEIRTKWDQIVDPKIAAAVGAVAADGGSRIQEPVASLPHTLRMVAVTGLSILGAEIVVGSVDGHWLDCCYYSRREY